MNYTHIKLNLKNLLAVLLVVLFTGETLFAESVAADMAYYPPQQAVSVSETITFFTQKQNAKRLGPGEADILKLSKLAQDVFAIKDFYVSADLKKQEARFMAVSTHSIIGHIQEKIENTLKWDEQLSNANIEKIKENFELLKRNLDNTSFSWAWIQNQVGQKAEAKKILVTKFENSYTQVMKMKETYNHDVSPLRESERISDVLKSLSTAAENKTREEQLKKMRTHVSTLPDMQIMT
jgi:hypothetical protein